MLFIVFSSGSILHGLHAVAHEGRQRIRDPSVELAVALVSTIDLVINDTVLYEKHSSGSAGGFNGVGDHQDRLAFLVNVGKLQEIRSGFCYVVCQ